jgi:hypothetical protein
MLVRRLVTRSTVRRFLAKRRIDPTREANVAFLARCAGSRRSSVRSGKKAALRKGTAGLGVSISADMEGMG